MRKVKFICFSDIQIEDFKRHNKSPEYRLKINGTILNTVRDLCIRHECPAIFCGDLFDDPQGLSNKVLDRTADWLNDFRRYKIKIFMIDGNHDQSEKNTLVNRSPNYVSTFSKIYSNIINISDNTIVHGNWTIKGIPYMTDKRDFLEVLKKTTRADILLIHTSLPGLKEPNGMELIVDYLDPKELKEQFNRFKIVLNGHIHKPQQAFDNVYTLGATHQQRLSDIGQEMGIWLMYDDYKMAFIPLRTPQFEYLEEGTKPANDIDFFITVPKEVEDKTKTGIKFAPTHSSNALAEKYMKAKGIKSRRKQELLFKYLNNARK